MEIAIIGTAGRDKTKPMTKALWDWMIQHAIENTPQGFTAVSGGAAWADHLAVKLFLLGHAGELVLHLPAPMENIRFIGQCGRTANYYHERFSKIIGEDSLKQIWDVVDEPKVTGTVQNLPGYQGMFARNKLIAQSPNLLAYTFGSGDIPADGGTKNTWDQCKGTKYHISLPTL